MLLEPEVVTSLLTTTSSREILPFTNEFGIDQFVLPSMVLPVADSLNSSIGATKTRTLEPWPLMTLKCSSVPTTLISLGRGRVKLSLIGIFNRVIRSLLKLFEPPTISGGANRVRLVEEA